MTPSATPRKEWKSPQPWLRLLPLGLAAVLMGMGGFLLSTFGTAQAQRDDEHPAPFNFDQFPEVSVSYICAPPPAPLDGYQLYEDGELRSVLFSTTVPISTPMRGAILLDFYRNPDGSVPPAALELLSKPGKNNDLGEYLISVTASGFAVPEDTLGILIPDVDLGTPQHISQPITFTSDVNRLFNGLASFDPAVSTPQLPPRGTTRLKDFVNNTLQLMEPESGRQDFILLFSDGTNNTSTATPSDVITRARTYSVPIHTVYITTTVPGDRDFLRDLSQSTGGQTLLASQTVSIVQLLMQSYVSVQQCTFIYRAQKAQPQNIIISHELITLARNSRTFPVPPLSVPPPVVSVELVQTKTQSIITKTDDLTLRFATEWNLTEYPSRHVDAVRYEIQNSSAVVATAEPPLDQLRGITHAEIISGNMLDPGSYLIKVSVVDELGLESADTFPFTLLDPAPMPTSTLTMSAMAVELTSLAWTRFRTTTSTFIQGVQDGIQGPYTPRHVLGLVLASVLLTLLILLLWGFRPKRWRRDWKDTTHHDETFKTIDAALVRVRRDPEAPALLHSVPLSPKIELDIPKDLYEPIRKNYQQNALLKSYAESYKAIVRRHANRTGKYIIARQPSNAQRKADAPLEQLAPIHIQAVETSSTFELEGDKPHTLQEGDIVQLGETHYKFVRRHGQDIQTNT